MGENGPKQRKKEIMFVIYVVSNWFQFMVDEWPEENLKPFSSLLASWIQYSGFGPVEDPLTEKSRLILAWH